MIVAETGDLGNVANSGDSVCPAMVDLHIRRAIPICWMLLPEERRSVSTVAAEIRRIVDRILGDLKEDNQLFGKRSQD